MTDHGPHAHGNTHHTPAPHTHHDRKEAGFDTVTTGHYGDHTSKAHGQKAPTPEARRMVTHPMIAIKVQVTLTPWRKGGCQPC